MSNFSTAVEATETALNSSGSAAQENSRYMESLEAKTQQLKATFQDLANNVIDSELVKSILNLTNSLLELANTSFGAFIIQGTLLTGVGWGLIKLFQAMNIINVVVANFKALPMAIFAVQAAMGGAATATEALGFAMNASLPIIAAVSLAVVGVVAIVKSMNEAYLEAHPTLEMIEEDLSELNSELEENKSRLQELESIPWADRTTSQKLEIERIKEENEVLKENIRLKNQQKAETWLQEKADVPTQYVAYEAVYDPRFAKFTEELNEIGARGTREELIQLIKTNDDLAKAFQEGTIKIREFNEEISNIDYINRSIEELNSLNDILNSGQSLVGDQKQKYQELVNVLGEYLTELDAMNDGTTLEAAGLDDLRNSLENLLTPAYEIVKQQKAVAEGFKLTENQAQKLIEKNPELKSSIIEVKDTFYLERDSLIDLASATEELGTVIIDSQTKAALTTKTAVTERLNYLRLEIEAVKNSSMEFSDYYWELVNAEQGIIDALVELASSTVVAPDIETGGTDSAIEKEKTLIDLLKEELELLEHQAFLAEKNGKDQMELVRIYEEAQKRIHAVAEEYRKQGYDDTSAEIRELQKLWWDYADEIADVNQSIADAQEKAAEEAKQAWEEAQQELIDELNDKKSAYETAFNYMADQIQKEIDALQEQRDAEEEYWDAKINALKDQNDEIERQIELEQLQEQLARARQGKVLVYKDGRFQYVQDVEAISEAEKSLEEYEREEALRQETENLEQLRDQALAAIDDQIKGWEKYKEEWSSVVDDYQEEQDRLLAEQVLGIELEGENWKTRLDNLADYISQYKALMAELTAAQNTTYEEQAPTTGGSSSSGGGGGLPSDDLYFDDSGSTAWIPGVGNVHVDIENGHTITTDLPVGTIVSPGGSSGKWEITGVNPDGSYQSKPVKGYASGTLSADGGISLVGEKGPELRVLGSGDGVIPSNITKNLMDIGKFSLKELLNKTSSITYNTFDKIVLPNVTDYASFVNEMKKFKQFTFQN